MVDNKSICALNKKAPDSIIYKDTGVEIICLIPGTTLTPKKFSSSEKMSNEKHRN